MKPVEMQYEPVILMEFTDNDIARLTKLARHIRCPELRRDSVVLKRIKDYYEMGCNKHRLTFHEVGTLARIAASDWELDAKFRAVLRVMDEEMDRLNAQAVEV